MRWTRKLRLTSVADADGEVVWSWRPDAGAKVCGMIRKTTVARKPGHRGEREVNRKLPRGESRMTPSEPVVNEARVFHSFSHARLRLQRAPGIPCALLKREVQVKPAQNLRREREVLSVNDVPFENRIRRVGKGASAPCPPCRSK